MKFYAEKTESGFIRPHDFMDGETIEGWRTGEVRQVTAKKARNWKNHKRLFSLFSLLLEAEPIEDYFKVTENLRYALMVGAGYFDWKPGIDGEALCVARSMSFEKMDEDEFRVMFENIIQTALSMLPQYLDGAQLDDMLDRVARF